jgi:Flp pilus assembly protein TadD
VGLGVAYATGRQTDAARQAFTHALEIDPESPEAWYNLGYLYWETGDVERAKQSLRRALQCDPGLTAAADLLAGMR